MLSQVVKLMHDNKEIRFQRVDTNEIELWRQAICSLLLSRLQERRNEEESPEASFPGKPTSGIPILPDF